MPLWLHYQQQLLEAKSLCDQRHYDQAQNVALQLYQQAKIAAHVCDKQPGQLATAQRLYDVAVHAHVLLRYIEQRQQGKGRR
jgi:hypothetical protein